MMWPRSAADLVSIAESLVSSVYRAFKGLVQPMHMKDTTTLTANQSPGIMKTISTFFGKEG